MTETKPPETVMGFLERRLTGQALKFQVGQQMFCMGCDQILDWQNAVSLDLVGKASNKLHFTRVVCGACWDKAVAHNVETARAECAKHAGEEIEAKITDGRMFIDEDTIATVKFESVKTPVTRLLRDGQTIQTEGYRIIIQECDWVDVVVCHDEKLKKWWAIERETGFSIANGPTRIAACVAAEKAVRKAGRAKYDEVKAKGMRQRNKILKNAAKAPAMAAVPAGNNLQATNP